VRRHSLIDDVLGVGGISILFQPIFEIVDGEQVLFALEALARGPKGSNVERADVLFEYVRRKGMEIEVDRVCIARAVAAAAGMPGSPSISINVHAATLEADSHFTSFLMETCSVHRLQPSRVILEIVEQQRFRDDRAFFRSLDELRSLGIRIALDDIGIGYSNHKMLIEVRPEIFKIDRYFITGCAENDFARAAIESIAHLASRLGGRVVAEGIESEGDYQAVSALGIDLVQGYFFARPSLPESFGTLIPHKAFATN
jgi:EAL domain-containing protein (putative c-di-GMP-specific phosphodiesterase class I)